MELQQNKDDGILDEITASTAPVGMDSSESNDKSTNLDDEDLGETHNEEENLPPGEADNDILLTPEEMEKLYDQFEMEDDADYNFERILDHEFRDGVLWLKARFSDDGIGEHDITVPFLILKKDVPLELAKFIQDKVMEHKCGGYYNTWAKNTLKSHARGVRRLY